MLSPKAKAIFAKKKASVGKPTFSGSPMKRKAMKKEISETPAQEIAESPQEQARERRMGTEMRG